MALANMSDYQVAMNKVLWTITNYGGLDPDAMINFGGISSADWTTLEEALATYKSELPSRIHATHTTPAQA